MARQRIAAFGVLLVTGASGAGETVLDPYRDVEWDTVTYLHSFSHQHATEGRLQTLRDMGYGHLPVSNYYPSKPLYPLPEGFRKANPGVLGAPNAEQHSTTDSPVHFNAIGSYYTTGYGETPRVQRDRSPIEYDFQGLHVFDPACEPWHGIYRLDLSFAAVAEAGAKSSVLLTVDGARQVSYKDFSEPAEGAIVRDRVLTPASARSLTLKAVAPTMRVRIVFDPAVARVTQFRLMQGTYRPWRDAFRAALDGETRDADGRPVAGLMFPEGGGITINHPTEPVSRVAGYLDFDARVLGIEVWNQHEMFGGQTLERAAALPFYTLWDEVLRTGRRCFGFFVKDHCLFGRGRNVLLVPPGGDVASRERQALWAYRNGCFFGLVGAMSVGADGKPAAPYDLSGFRFTRMTLRREEGRPVSLEVSVDGADTQRRPNMQIRFLTDQGLVHVVDGGSATFVLPRAADGRVACRYVRAEAFAYPNTHSGGQVLTPGAFAALNVFQIARLHDVRGDSGVVYMDGDSGTPLGIADMLFAQPILFR